MFLLGGWQTLITISRSSWSRLVKTIWIILGQFEYTNHEHLLIQSRVYRPGIYPRNMKLDSKTASFYYSRPSEYLDGRRAIVPCAHVLGGGSSINFMMYISTPKKKISFAYILQVYSSLCQWLWWLQDERLGNEEPHSLDEGKNFPPQIRGSHG